MGSDDEPVTPTGTAPIATSEGRIPALSVAVTGGIGAGKSTVSAALAGRGAVLVDSDALAREVVEPATPGLAAISEAFGDGVIAGDGRLDRAALAGVIFSDPAARRTLEAITHPLVRRRYAELRSAAPQTAIIVNDIPLVNDVQVAAGFQLVIGVGIQDEELRVRRLIDRGLAEQDTRARIAAQISDTDRRRLCDVWLDNSADITDLHACIDPLWQRLTEFASNRLALRKASWADRMLTEPDPSWPDQAALLAARVSQAVGGARVDHIGSTAIPGLPAKNVIDLQLTAESLEQAEQFAPALAAAGFPGRPTSDNAHPVGAQPWRKWLHGNADPGRRVNLHVRVRDSPGWRWALLFPRWLASDTALAAEYLQVKQNAAELQAAGTMNYPDAKEPWFEQAYPRGLAWADSTGWAP